MKQALASGILIVFLQSCAWLPKPGPPSVVGKWINPIGTIWMIKTDGTFEVDLTRDGQRDAWGEYTVTGRTITLVALGGVKPKDCDGKGIYNFKREGDKLRFTLVSDACKLRKRNVLLSWHLKT